MYPLKTFVEAQVCCLYPVKLYQKFLCLIISIIEITYISKCLPLLARSVTNMVPAIASTVTLVDGIMSNRCMISYLTFLHSFKYILMISSQNDKPTLFHQEKWPKAVKILLEHPCGLSGNRCKSDQPVCSQWEDNPLIRKVACYNCQLDWLDQLVACDWEFTFLWQDDLFNLDNIVSLIEITIAEKKIIVINEKHSPFKATAAQKTIKYNPSYTDILAKRHNITLCLLSTTT
jgi:hypothetical protein